MTDSAPSSFGAVLRSRREKLGLSLDDVANSTRVRKTYLQALEEENLQALPGNAYAIGFLRIYARQLGLPVEPLLASLEGFERAEGREPATVLRNETGTARARSRRRGPRGRVLLLVALLVLAVGALVYLRGISREQPSEPPPTPQPPAAPNVAPPPSPPPQPLPAVVAPPAAQGQPEVAAVELPVLPGGGAIVRMVPMAVGMMKVSLDGQEVREYALQPDQALNWKVAGSLAVELSAPALVKVWVGQEEIAVAEHPKFILKGRPQPEGRP